MSFALKAVSCSFAEQSVWCLGIQQWHLYAAEHAGMVLEICNLFHHLLIVLGSLLKLKQRVSSLREWVNVNLYPFAVLCSAGHSLGAAQRRRRVQKAECS